MSSVKSFEKWQKWGRLDNTEPRFEASLAEVVASVKKMKSERRKKSSNASEVD